jgi:two-component system LytT family response regulator
MKKVILIDDETLGRNLLAEYLEEHPDLEIVEECANGFEGIKAIGRHQPDLVFLDIHMPKINGFEMIELLPDCPPIIFTTAFDEFALKAFEANAIDYLLKPFSKERLATALNKWRTNTGTDPAVLQKFVADIPKHPEEQNRIVVKQGNDIRIIPTSEICFLEAYDDYVKIHTATQYFLKKNTMNYFEQILGANNSKI